MNRTVWFIVCLLIPLSTWGENSCTNGSFEEVGANGIPIDWSPMGESVLSADAHSGRNSFQVIRRSEVFGPEAGLNRDWVPESGQQGAMIGQTRGGMEFWYKSLSRKGAVMNVMVIPMNGKPLEETSASRTTYEIPGEHDGDGVWHRMRIKYDYTSNPEVKWVHFAARVAAGFGEFLIDDISYLDEVGPFLILDGLRIEEDKEAPGERGTLTARIRNTGDCPADNIMVKAEGPAGVSMGPLPLIISNLPVDRAERARLALVGPRTSSLHIAPGMEVISFGQIISPGSNGLTLECVFLNGGNAILVEPQAEFTSEAGKQIIKCAAILPGQTKAFTNSIWTPSPTRSLAPSVRCTAKNKEGEIYLESKPFHPPRRLSGPIYEPLISNNKIRLIIPEARDIHTPIDIIVQGRGVERHVACIPQITRLVFRDSRGLRVDATDMLKIPGRNQIDLSHYKGKSIAFPLTYTDMDGANWEVKTRFELKEGASVIDVSYEVTCDQPRDLLAFDGPMVYVLERDEAVYPGLEWLVPGEVSSSDLDINKDHPHRNRTVVHPNMITIPAIGVHSKNGTVGLLWDAKQKWDGERDRPCAVFASPDRRERLNQQRAHLMGLMVPTVPDFMVPNQYEAEKPYPLRPDTPLRLQCKIYADAQGKDALTAIDQWFKEYPLPPASPLPHGSYEGEIEFSMRGYLESLWVPETKEWFFSKNGIPALSGKQRPRTFIADLLLGSLLSPTLEVRTKCFERADEVLKLIGGEPRLDAQLFPGKTEVSLANKDAAGTLLALRGQDGGWRFDADYQDQETFKGLDYRTLGPDDALEIGTCAQKAYTILRYALIAGDAQVYQSMVKTLELMETFKVPRAAQVWEVPVHTPDILASADAVDAFLAAYRFSGEERWLRDAVFWARTGIPFVYVWDDSKLPFLLGASIPVFGASLFNYSWFGLPVQWNGLRYAMAIMDLAEYDSSYPWRDIARLIIHSATHQQAPEGEDVALWPDNVSAINGVRCPWVFAPHQILQAVCRLTGRDLVPKTKVVRSDDQAVHVTAMANIRQTTWTDETLSINLEYAKKMQGVVLFANLTQPEKVVLNGTAVETSKDIEAGGEPGWRYDSQNAWLAVRVPKEGPSVLQIQGARYRTVERLPKAAQYIDFEFMDSNEGWSPLHDVEDFGFAEGKLKGRITGPDPYVGRTLLRAESAGCPKVSIHMKVTVGEYAQFYWVTENAPEFNEQKVTVFKVLPDGEFHTYTMDLSQHPLWVGQTITSIRLDPTNGADTGEFEIDWIRAVR